MRSKETGPETGNGFTMNIHEWPKSHELWTSDIRNLDLGLVEDKIERAIREIYNKYLLTDAGSSRLVLVLPSVVPHPLLASLLSAIFQRWRYPSITLLPAATMSTVSAGLRSSLVVDIGWEETTVTAIYEYREIQSKRSVRAMKNLMQYMGKFLTSLIHEKEGGKYSEEDETVSVTFEYCEELLTRQAWCKPKKPLGDTESQETDNSAPSEANDDEPSSKLSNTSVNIPLPLRSGPTYVDVPFSKFSDPVEATLFGIGSERSNWDDQDMPLDILIYKSLLSLSPDIRGSCMSRIIFMGGGANIPGIRERILNDVDSQIREYQWNPTSGRIISKRRMHQDAKRNGVHDKNTAQERPEPESNFIDERFEQTSKDSKPYAHGIVRQVETLGPWAGASLLAGLRVKGVVEIEREKFLHLGLSGASREGDISTAAERRSGHGSGVARPGADRSSWTLAEWG